MNHKTCSNCVLDTSDKDIFFDANGVCNYCKEVERRKKQTQSSKFDSIENIKQVLTQDKAKYDCLIGVSGGVDSSYVVHIAYTLGLNPLLVHCDNGWNSPSAVKNINKLIDKTDFDYQTIVLDWEEIKDLQRAFLKSSVVDIEMVTDQAITATVYKTAQKNRIKYLLTGNNDATENCMPASWYWRKSDKLNLINIHKRFGHHKLKHYPIIGPLKLLLLRNTCLGPTPIDILNYVPFSNTLAIETLSREYGWEYYGGKHYESTFTKFYQAHILPKKFGIDKRLAHLSALIRNGEMTREKAIEKLEEPLFEPNSLKRELRFFLEKLDMSMEEYNEIMSTPPVQHRDYGTDTKLYKLAKRMLKV